MADMRIRIIDWADVPTGDKWVNGIDELKEWARQRQSFDRYEFYSDQRINMTTPLKMVLESDRS